MKLLIRILLFLTLSCQFAELYAQNKLLIASKLLDEAEEDPTNRTNASKLNTAVAYFADVLKEQGINCSIGHEDATIDNEEVSVPYILVSPEGSHYLNKFASSMGDLNVDLVFNPYSLIDNEASAMFEPGGEESSDNTRSRMSLSREFIEEYGGTDKMTVKHEMRHFLSYILAAMGYDSIYAAEIRFKIDKLDNKAYKAGFVLDELPAWGEDIYEYTRRLKTSFKKFYLGFHPEVGQIALELRSYLNDHIAESDLDALDTKKQIMDFIYFYADGIENTEGRVKKLEGLLNSFYLPKDKKLKNDMKNKILGLANRDLMAETDLLIKDGKASFYDPMAMGKRLSELDFVIRSISAASVIMDKLSTTAENSLHFVLSRKDTMSYGCKTKPGYKLSFKYTTGMTINYKLSTNSVTNNKVHMYEVETNSNISSYKVKITANGDNENIKEVLFNRLQEQIDIARKYNEHNKRVINKAKEYQELFKSSEDRNLSAKDIAVILRDKVNEMIETAKDLSRINKESFSNGLDINDAIPAWRKYVESIGGGKNSIEELPLKKNTKVDKTNKGGNDPDDTQYCEFDFNNSKKTSMIDKLNMNKTEADIMTELSAYLGTPNLEYKEQIDLFLKDLAGPSGLGEAEADLLFGAKNEMGERSGGLFNYWAKDPASEGNWIYIALTGALAYESLSNERNISRTIIKAYTMSGLMSMPTSEIVRELESRDLMPKQMGLELMTIKIDAIKLFTSKTRTITR